MNQVEKTSNFVTWLIFLTTLTVVVISTISVIFPALILSNSQTVQYLESLGISQKDPESFEIGVWTIPLIITNVIVFAMYFLYVKERLPNTLSNVLKKTFRIKISKKITFMIIGILLSIYIIGSAGELASEENWGDYGGVKDKTENRSLEQAFRSFDVPLKFFFLSSSLEIFDNIRVIPFLASIAMLLLTYFVTSKISNSRFAGIVAFIILLQSNLFLSYDTSATYENFWILFYLLSLYLMYRFWSLSSIAYILSTLAKPLTLIFLPMSIVFILRAEIETKKKLMILLSYGIVVLISIVLVVSLGINVSGREEAFSYQEFLMGFTSFAYQLRFDGLVLLFLIPLIFGLFIASIKKIKNAESVMVLILGTLLITPALAGFTVDTNQPYRFISLIVFFAMGVGVLLSSKKQA